MAYISTPALENAPDATAAMYREATDSNGTVPNMVRVFGHRPEVMAAWRGLAAAIRGNMSLRRYELVTIAAAQELRSSYCLLAHGGLLLQSGVSRDELLAIMTGGDGAGLSEAERAIMDYARHVVRDASSVTVTEIERLQSIGLSDAEIFDIAATAAVRCFFSKTLDALGAEPDAGYANLGPDLLAALAIGRPVEPDQRPA